MGALPRAVRVGAGPHWAASFQAFTLMDQNRDGFIDKEDLKDTYASLGGCRAELHPSPRPSAFTSALQGLSGVTGQRGADSQGGGGLGLGPGRNTTAQDGVRARGRSCSPPSPSGDTLFPA